MHKCVHDRLPAGPAALGLLLSLRAAEEFHQPGRGVLGQEQVKRVADNRARRYVEVADQAGRPDLAEGLVLAGSDIELTQAQGHGNFGLAVPALPGPVFTGRRPGLRPGLPRCCRDCWWAGRTAAAAAVIPARHRISGARRLWFLRSPGMPRRQGRPALPAPEVQLGYAVTGALG